MACCDVSPVAMFILKSMASLIGKYSQTMEYIPTEEFPNFENISLPANKMLWLSTKCEYFPTSSTKWEYFPTSSRKSEEFPKTWGVADMKVDMVARCNIWVNLYFSTYPCISEVRWKMPIHPNNIACGGVQGW